MLQTARCSSVKQVKLLQRYAKSETRREVPHAAQSQLSGEGPLNIGTKEFVNRNADRSLQFTQNAPCVDFFSGTDQTSGLSFWIFRFLDIRG